MPSLPYGLYNVFAIIQINPVNKRMMRGRAATCMGGSRREAQAEEYWCSFSFLSSRSVRIGPSCRIIPGPGALCKVTR